MARVGVLVTVAVAALAGLAASARLGLIVLATPAPAWLADVSPLIGPASTADMTVRSLAARVADDLSDSALVRGRHAACAAEIDAATAAGDVPRRATAIEACLVAVDDGLAANPTSGELWLERARLLSLSGIFDERLQTALRQSYAASPHEGWIAASRVVLAFRLQPLLPAEFAPLAVRDLGAVLKSRALAAPLVEAYLADEALRPIVTPAVESVPDVEAQERFVSMVRGRLAAVP